MIKKVRQRVFVGMSGGVDSSVAAALLRRAGYEVLGVFIKVWEPDGIKCTWRDDRRDAMRVAAVLGIPLVTIDLSREYERAVVLEMIREYRAGRTPNPDIECNRTIKFGAFYDWALKQGADFVATGHYARVKDGELLAARDENKDQSYFLWTLKAKQLPHCLFPIGDYQKSEVRKLAKKFHLPTALKKDSQGLCFIGKLDFKKFLQRYIKPRTGKVMDESGQIRGIHDGVWFYTIGQKHHGYIVAKDVRKNILIVADRPPVFAHHPVSLTGANWLTRPELHRSYRARVRHRGALLPCWVDRLGRSPRLIFSSSGGEVAPGQSLVLYDGEKCLGGGVVL